MNPVLNYAKFHFFLKYKFPLNKLLGTLSLLHTSLQVQIRGVSLILVLLGRMLLLTDKVNPLTPKI